jgi:hypothetical protein
MSIPAHPRFVVDENGQPTMVMLDFAGWIAMVQSLKDRLDPAVLEQRVKVAGTPLREVLAKKRYAPQ